MWRLTVLSVLAASCAWGADCTPVSGYGYCRQLTLDYTQAGSSDSSNWPLVTQNGSTAMTLGSGRIRNASCYDVVFTSDSGGTTLVPWETESCTQATGAVIAWVKVGTLSHTANTYVYVSYGNTAISSAQNTGSLAPANVWDSHYTGVFHFPNGSSLDVTDSTGLNSVANHSATAGTGQIDGDASLGGAAYIDLGSASGLNSAARTGSCWVNASSLSNAYTAIMSANWSGGAWQLFVKNDGKLAVYITAGGPGHYDGSGAHTLSAGTPYYLTFVYDSAVGAIGYVNAQQDATFAASGDIHTTGFTGIQLGQDQVYGGRLLSGSLDECEISNTARSASWIAAEYNNQKPSSTFLTVGAEQAGASYSVARRRVIN